MEEISDIEELTAYLDGELDQAAIERIESRLASDPKYLAEMQQLQQTWDLLDRFPEREPGSSFTKTTMELAFGDEVKRKRSSPVGVWGLRTAVMLSIPILLFATSYGLVRNKQAQPDRFLLENLSVIDRHAYYTIAGNDAKFVDGLLELFSGSGGIGPELTPDQGELVAKLLPTGLDAREIYVRSLPAQEKLRLEKQMSEFLNKPEAKQNALKRFDDEMNSKDDASERIYVLKQYYEWLRGLKQEERTTVMGLPAQECLVEIEKIRNVQASNKLSIAGLAEVPPHDIELVFGWYDSVCFNSRGRLRDRFARTVSQHARQLGRKPSPEVLRIAKRGFFPRLVKVLLELDREFVEKTVVSDDNLELLELMVSQEAKEVLYSRDADEQKKLVFQWFESANQAKFDVRPEDLYRFEKSLDSQKKSQLRDQNLSSQQYIAAIRRLYREKNEPLSRPINSDDQLEILLDQLQNQAQ